MLLCPWLPSTDQLRINCEHHGEIAERYDSDPDYPRKDVGEDGAQIPVSGLSDYEKFSIINYRKRATRTRTQGREEDLETSKDKTSKKKKANTDMAPLLDERAPFYPCDHEGPCTSESNCSCFRDKVHCEKSCGCSSCCERRFTGCRCALKGKVCIRLVDQLQEKNKCACIRLNRECDPDLCGKCGVAEVIDPANRNESTQWLATKCQNCNLQRGIPKRTLIGTSAIHGFGLFMGEDVKAGDFVSEYKGEITGDKETERRGVVDDHSNSNYLFQINKGVCILRAA